MIVEITCLPEEVTDAVLIEKKIQKAAGKFKYKHYQLIRRWIDARGQPKFGLRFELGDKPLSNLTYQPDYQDVSNEETVHIIGAGPAGYFAALECLIQGLKPHILEQGKDVRTRRRDLRAIQQEGVVNRLSNYCFGEGGAGTYSDGKLYTRAKKRGDVAEVLQLLVHHGASEDILVDAHPHIGSNKLPQVIAAIRKTITEHGGVIEFNQEVTDIITSDGRIDALQMNGDELISVRHVVLATGHSARPIYELFVQKGWAIHAKPFALGVRIEHPQTLIDSIQYGQAPRHDQLPAAEYRLTCQVEDRGVFSFCMCPGGLIVPAATAPGEVVVNGMSLSRRDSPFANSGFVTAIEIEDLTDDIKANPLVCLDFQRKVERRMFEAGNGSQSAPAQRVVDFIQGKASRDLPSTSYIPGIFPARLDQLLPPFVTNRLRRGFLMSNQKMRNYVHPEAVIVGVESRTSAPVSLPRDRENFQHPDVSGLYPCGEGAGYAGGIMSAAMDGRRVIRALAKEIIG